MKKCSYCGKVYADSATVCEVDHQPLWEVNPLPLPGSPVFAPADTRQIIDSEHLKMLAIFHYIFAGLALLGLLFLGVHFVIMSTVFSSPQMWQQKNYSGPPPEFFKLFFTFFYLILGGTLAIAGVLNLLSANFMRQRKHRVFSFVVACLNCLEIPFGTVLGVFTIIVLSRPSVRAQYGE